MDNKLTFGYLYDFRNPLQWRRPWAELYAGILDFAAWTESIGFDGAWVPEHHGAEDGYMPSPLIALAAIAARTRTIKLGSAIALAPLYHPVRFAEECAVLDHLSNGRLEMAAAIGYRRREAEAYGVDFSKRGGRTDEFLEIVTRLWTGETVSFEGKHFNIKNASIAQVPARGRIPLYIGGFNEKAIERTAKYGDGYFGNMDIVDLYLDKLRAAGKDPASGRIRIQGLFVMVAHDPAQAMDELAPYFHHVNNTYGQWLNEDRGSTGVEGAVLKPMSLQAFKTSGILSILTPSQAIAMFREMRAKVPVEHFMMMLPPGLPPAQFKPYAEVFAKDVMPAFR
ncbi:MAG: class flavin-dependent oxidoreductase [Hydrocarboniphaga sp.]|uniref:LLM class flavin-dependent oxidoreductase n=1 Tax=Hydrocarboniphaga sp. TaxID=2033016 RepID=UPI002615B742|nr:LLM class flavin-dependent oxidoreductase [Hydrocarboniphaga sp.]MDB5970408.1 class flavin-dependent oxidoreductase [Hydrocarboniphaga sp.]